MKNSNIISGIHINNIDISKLSIEEAREKLYSELSLHSSLHLTYQDYETTIFPSDIDFLFDINTTLQDAYNFGRSNNIFVNNFKILSSLIASQNFDAKYLYNEEKLNYIITNIGYELPGLVVEPSYYTENNNLIILKGNDGIKLCSDDLKNLILSSICNSNSSSDDIIEISIPVRNCSPSRIDINKIYSEIHTEPQNAYIEKNPFVLHKNIDGVDFAISIEDAKKLLEEDLKEYIIPLKVVSADITVDDLENDIFVDTLSTYSSKYNASNKNRTNNVIIATNKINDVVILPGETFSYNQIVGERTISAGFKEASVYTSQGVEYGVGGGICQVSSTLYNAVVMANLEILERKNHRYSVPYVPLGCDATVAYGSIDFRFKNSRNFPVKLQASADNGVLSISVIGMFEDTEYDVSISTKKISTIPFDTKYVYDSSLPAGSQVIKQSGYYGYKINSYKVVKLNDIVISETLISSDTYSPLSQIVRVSSE